MLSSLKWTNINLLEIYWKFVTWNKLRYSLTWNKLQYLLTRNKLRYLLKLNNLLYLLVWNKWQYLLTRNRLWYWLTWNKLCYIYNCWLQIYEYKCASHVTVLSWFEHCNAASHIKESACNICEVTPCLGVVPCTTTAWADHSTSERYIGKSNGVPWLWKSFVFDGRSERLGANWIKVSSFISFQSLGRRGLWVEERKVISVREFQM